MTETKAPATPATPANLDKTGTKPPAESTKTVIVDVPAMIKEIRAIYAELSSVNKAPHSHLKNALKPRYDELEQLFIFVDKGWATTTDETSAVIKDFHSATVKAGQIVILLSEPTNGSNQNNRLTEGATA